jgi:hypothetical protein
MGERRLHVRLGWWYFGGNKKQKNHDEVNHHVHSLNQVVKAELYYQDSLGLRLANCFRHLSYVAK